MGPGVRGEDVQGGGFCLLRFVWFVEAAVCRLRASVGKISAVNVVIEQFSTTMLNILVTVSLLC